MIDFKKITTIPNRYNKKYGKNSYSKGNRRTALEFAIPFSENNIFCEFGVFKGESANWLLDSKCEKLYLFDSFEGLPKDWNEKFKKGHFKCDVPTFNDPRVVLIKGYFEDNINKFNEIQFGLVHIDCDLYDSTKTILNNIKIFKNQIIVFDEFYNINNSENHEYKAFLEFINERNVKYEILGKTEYSQVIIRIL
jgi:hypothetical protein